MDALHFNMNIPMKFDDDEPGGIAYIKAQMCSFFDWELFPDHLYVLDYSVDWCDEEELDVNIEMAKKT